MASREIYPLTTDEDGDPYGRLTAMAWSPSGDAFAVGFLGGNTEAWLGSFNTRLHLQSPNPESEREVAALTFACDDSRVLFVVYRLNHIKCVCSLRVFRLGSEGPLGPEMRVPFSFNTIHCCAAHALSGPGGPVLVAVVAAIPGGSISVDVWEFENAAFRLLDRHPLADAKQVECIAFSPAGTALAVVVQHLSRRSSLHVYPLNRDGVSFTEAYGEKCAPIRSVVWRADGRVVATIDRNDRLRAHDTHGQDLNGALVYQADGVVCACPLPPSGMAMFLTSGRVRVMDEPGVMIRDGPAVRGPRAGHEGRDGDAMVAASPSGTFLVKANGYLRVLG